MAMKVHQLIEDLQQQDPDAEVRIREDQGRFLEFEFGLHEDGPLPTVEARTEYYVGGKTPLVDIYLGNTLKLREAY